MVRVINLYLRKILILSAVILIVSRETFFTKGIKEERKEALLIERYTENLPDGVKFYYLIKSKKFKRAYKLFIEKNRKRIKFWDNYILPYIKKEDVKAIENAVKNKNSNKIASLSIRKYLLEEKINMPENEEITLQEIKYCILVGNRKRAIKIAENGIKNRRYSKFYKTIFMLYKYLLEEKKDLTLERKLKENVLAEKALIPIVHNAIGIKKYKKGNIDGAIKSLLMGIKKSNLKMGRNNIILLENLIPFLTEKGWYYLAYMGIKILQEKSELLDKEEQKDLIYNRAILEMQIGDKEESIKSINQLKGKKKKDLLFIYNLFYEKENIKKIDYERLDTKKLVNLLMLVDSEKKYKKAKRIIKILEKKDLGLMEKPYKEILQIYKIKHLRKGRREKIKEIKKIVKESLNRNVKLIGEYIMAELENGEKSILHFEKVIRVLEKEWGNCMFKNKQFFYFKSKREIYDEFVKKIFKLVKRSKRKYALLFSAMEMGKRRTLKQNKTIKLKEKPTIKDLIKGIEKKITEKKNVVDYKNSFKKAVFISSIEDREFCSYYISSKNDIYLMRIFDGRVKINRNKLKEKMITELGEIINSFERGGLTKKRIKKLKEIEEVLLLDKIINGKDVIYVSTDGILDTFPLNLLINKEKTPVRDKIIIKVMESKKGNKKWSERFLLLINKKLNNSTREEENVKNFVQKRGLILDKKIMKRNNYIYIHIIAHLKKIEDEYKIDLGKENLSLKDLKEQHISGKAVILTCCNSEYGKYIPGEGIIGFVRYFFKNGTNYLIGTTYKIDDYSTSIFFKIFFRNLMDKDFEKAYIESLKKFKNKNLFYSPYYWAGLELIEKSFNYENLTMKGIRDLTYSAITIILLCLMISLRRLKWKGNSK